MALLASTLMNQDALPRLRINLVQATGVLTAVFLIALVAFGTWGFYAHGTSGVLAAIIAGSVCWFAGCLAISLVAMMQKPEHVLHAVLGGMSLRMLIPLAAGVLITKLSAPLAEANLFGMMVGFYLIGLAVETYLAVQLAAASNNR